MEGSIHHSPSIYLLNFWNFVQKCIRTMSVPLSSNLALLSRKQLSSVVPRGRSVSIRQDKLPLSMSHGTYPQLHWHGFIVVLFLLQEHVRQSREQQLNEIGKHQEHLEGKHAKVGTVSIHSNSTQSSDSQRLVGHTIDFFVFITPRLPITFVGFPFDRFVRRNLLSA